MEGTTMKRSTLATLAVVPLAAVAFATPAQAVTAGSYLTSAWTCSVAGGIIGGSIQWSRDTSNRHWISHVTFSESTTWSNHYLTVDEADNGIKVNRWTFGPLNGSGWNWTVVGTPIPTGSGHNADGVIVVKDSAGNVRCGPKRLTD
jgi:hypothetical protein